jgi:hypothetical protein
MEVNASSPPLARVKISRMGRVNFSLSTKSIISVWMQSHIMAASATTILWRSMRLMGTDMLICCSRKSKQTRSRGKNWGVCGMAISRMEYLRWVNYLRFYPQMLLWSTFMREIFNRSRAPFRSCLGLIVRIRLLSSRDRVNSALRVTKAVETTTNIVTVRLRPVFLLAWVLNQSVRLGLNSSARTSKTHYPNM